MQGFLRSCTRSFLVLLVVVVAASYARHLGENSLAENSQYMTDSEPNQYEPGMKTWQMELIAQKLAELNNPIGFQRDLRSETERKRRFRACYFNPVSCFKK
uniref:Allatotropin-C n=1 Tax=Colaphellus bowringi TaxID=561076 RepID=A0A7H1K1C1_9CUCU|nr:allatotropin-C [Colaphellus bowringi]